MYSNIHKNKRRYKYRIIIYEDTEYSEYESINEDTEYSEYESINEDTNTDNFINNEKITSFTDKHTHKDITSYILTICVILLLCIYQFTNLHRLSHS